MPEPQLPSFNLSRRTKLRPLENLPLWDIWYTGLSPFPSDIINPSIRASLVAGLLQPQAFAETSDSHAPSPIIPPLRDLPDISILFKRYLDSSKMINVYDWYESFVVALETQRRELQKAERLRNTNGDDGVSQRSQTPRTPRTPKRGRKGKERATEEEENVNEDEVEEMTEEDVEKWRIEVQARFMRSYHDLEFMGFIKPTGRKADHVIKTIYDLPD